jgi:hypothetical protein
MRFAVASEHRQFFRKNQCIEFDGILNSEQALRLKQEIEKALSQRLGVTLEKLKEISPEKLFTEGRDLWRVSPSLRKLILQSSFAEIAADLVEKKPIRIGYDQFFPKKISRATMHESYSLNEMSCLKGIVCGFMLCISQTSDIKETPPLSLFSCKAGNGVYFHPDLALSFFPPPECQGNAYLLIVYCQETAIYYLQEKDPHTHALKHLGYIYGDKLSSAHHPIIYR